MASELGTGTIYIQDGAYSRESTHNAGIYSARRVSKS